VRLQLEQRWKHRWVVQLVTLRLEHQLQHTQVHQLVKLRLEHQWLKRRWVGRLGWFLLELVLVEQQMVGMREQLMSRLVVLLVRLQEELHLRHRWVDQLVTLQLGHQLQHTQEHQLVKLRLVHQLLKRRWVGRLGWFLLELRYLDFGVLVSSMIVVLENLVGIGVLHLASNIVVERQLMIELVVDIRYLLKLVRQVHSMDC
jgi:hypothetical protein